MTFSPHHVARRVTLVGLVVGAVALIGLIAWTSYVRATWDPVDGFPGSSSPARSFIPRGFQLIALHPDYAWGATIAGAVAAGGIALAAVVWRRRRWGFLVAAIGSSLVLVAPWLARAYVAHIETVTAGRRWAARSPYVSAATTVAVATTIFLVLLAAAALIAFATAPRAARPVPAGAPAAPDQEPGAAG